MIPQKNKQGLIGKKEKQQGQHEMPNTNNTYTIRKKRGLNIYGHPCTLEASCQELQRTQCGHSRKNALGF